MNQESLNKALYAKLTGNATVTTLFGNRIYGTGRADATGTPTYPYLTFDHVATAPVTQFNGKTLEAADVQVDIFTDSSSSVTASALCAAVVAALDDQALSFSATSNDYVTVRVRRAGGPTMQFEERVIHGILLYEVYAQETA